MIKPILGVFPVGVMLVEDLPLICDLLHYLH